MAGMWSILCSAEDFELPAYHSESDHWPALSLRRQVGVHFYTVLLVASGDETCGRETGLKLVCLVIHDDVQSLLF